MPEDCPAAHKSTSQTSIALLQCGTLDLLNGIFETSRMIRMPFILIGYQESNAAPGFNGLFGSHRS
jgi:hypothetical protein